MEKPKNWGELFNDWIISKSKNRKNGENTGNISKIEKSKIGFLGNVIRKVLAKFQKASTLEIPKNWGELNNDVNITKSENWKNSEN